MKYYFSRLTQATIVFTVSGLLISAYLLFSNIKTTTPVATDLVLTNTEGNVLDTLRFQYRRQLMYNSTVVGESKHSGTQVKASQFFFHYNPDFLVWLLLAMIMLSIAIGILPALLDRLLILCVVFKFARGTLIMMLPASIIIGLLFMGLLVHNPFLYTYIDWINQLSILFSNTHILRTVVAIPTISGLFGLVGMILISRSISTLDPTSDEIQRFKNRFYLLNKSLRFFLTIATVLITFAVFTTGALRNAILMEVTVEGFDMVPLEFVYLYGLQFTIVLAIFYLPIYYQLRNKAELFVKCMEKETDPPDTSLLSIRAFMNESVTDNLKIALSIMAPLISSFLPDIIHI